MFAFLLATLLLSASFAGLGITTRSTAVCSRPSYNRRNDCEAIFELDCKEADCESAVERVPNFESRKEGKQKPMIHRKESPFKGHKSKGHDFSQSLKKFNSLNDSPLIVFVPPKEWTAKKVKRADIESERCEISSQTSALTTHGAQPNHMLCQSPCGHTLTKPFDIGQTKPIRTYPNEPFSHVRSEKTTSRNQGANIGAGG